MKKIFKRKQSHKTEQQKFQRITTDTVAEHREKVLAGGRRFKYPVQYTRHKLVFNAIILAIIAVLAVVAFSWWQLYKTQSTNAFFYRVTTLVPLPVASVDGATAQYSDYLMRYRSQEHWLGQKGQIEQSEEDGARQRNHIKRQILDGVQTDAYASKLAREKNITVEQSEVDAVVTNSLKTANGMISQEQYDASTLDTLGYSPSEYRHLIYQALLRQKVAYEIDEKAKATANRVEGQLESNKDFAAVVETVGDGAIIGNSGLVRKTNQDGGLTQIALTLQQGQISDIVKSTTGDGYYIVRLDEVTDSELSYSFIKVPLTELTSRMQKIKKDGKIKEYISIPENTATVEQ